jgi:hypothetical protein
MSGVCAADARAQRRECERMQHWRRFWVLRGYFGMKKKYRPGSHGAGS